MRPMQKIDKLPNIGEVSKTLVLPYDKVRYRMMILNIDKSELTEQNIRRIKNFKPKKVKVVSIFGFKEKEKIINYYLLNKNNTYDNIRKELNFTLYQIAKTIDEYLMNDNCLIVESKIN